MNNFVVLMSALLLGQFLTFGQYHPDRGVTILICITAIVAMLQDFYNLVTR